MEYLTEAKKETALKNYLYRKNYYNQYQKDNKEIYAESSRGYFENIRNDEEKKEEYTRKKQEYYKRVGKERYERKKTREENCEEGRRPVNVHI